MHLYVARELTPGKPEREPGEQIDNFVVLWQEALEMVEQRVIRDAKTIAGLLLYDRLRGKS
jgi:ADP-ribose pyrophosphatase